ncbi:MAG: DUF4173 domain-containing protein, partial [Anaerolineaceae bacterium]|nr:DUF4173 domain-containing protein [Anaerolineaceae bacterium]
TTREGKTQTWLFSGLGLLLIAQVGVMLVSAHTRLSLYEAVYSFTRLRTITHIFIFWLGFLLLVAAVLELTRRMYRLPLAVILFIFGFGITVNVVNLDRFIVEQNLTQAINDDGQSDYAGLDTRYLYSLSSDAIPPLVEAFKDPTLPDVLKEELGGLLACQYANDSIYQNVESSPWFTWQASRAEAVKLLNAQSSTWNTNLESKQDGWYVTVNDELRPCYDYISYGWD